MDLTPYVESLRADLEAAAAAGTDATRETARLLSAALEPAVRLSLVDALSAMAAEVTATGGAGSVEIRMHGREPQVVVLSEEPAAEPPVAPPAPPPPPEADDEGGTARVSLRLPESLKAQTEERAAAEGLSLNSWIVRAVHHAVHGGAHWNAHGWSIHGPAGTWGGHGPGRRGGRITGFGRA